MSSLAALALSAAAAAPICTDRPAKASVVCTVPAGMLQIESGLAGWGLATVAGTRSTILTVAPTTAKLGLTGTSDLQVSVTPYAEARVRGGGSVSGIGDVVLRYKQRLTGTDAPIEFAVIPVVKVPTAARGLGNERVEGGVAVPVSFAVAGLAPFPRR